jgi:hypothetical protein
MFTHHRVGRAAGLLVAVVLTSGCASKKDRSEGPPPATAPVLVRPTDWGPAADGLRLGIAAERMRFAVGERIQLSAAARNESGNPLTLRLPPAGEPEVSFRGDLITLKYRLDDGQRMPIAKGQAWSGALSGPLSLAPGTYRLRAVIWADELASAEAGAGAPPWHGEARSNEITIEVIPPAR